MMAFSFRTIDVTRDLSTCIDFRKDSFRVSFGSEKGFNLGEYVKLLTERTVQFPWGYVMVEENGDTVGQMEIFTRDHEERLIGFVSLYYLVPSIRGQGKGAQLSDYAEHCFRNQGVTEYHLRVSPANLRAVRFYQKCGLIKLQEEGSDHTVWRMGKKLI